jgi:hypothetical protein
MSDIENQQIVKIYNWYVIARGGLIGNWSTPVIPEISSYKIYLRGNVFGHPRVIDGHNAVTTNIVSSRGRFVTTESGTVYKLCRINKMYRKFLSQKKYEYNPRNPIIKEMR